MNIDRRNFLKFAVAGIIALTDIAYEEVRMKQYARRIKNGRKEILADLHAHHSKDYPLEEQLVAYSSGLNGITSFLDLSYLSYQYFVRSNAYTTEISKGMLARVILDSNEEESSLGYVVNTQEVEANPRFHILAIGCLRRIQDHQDPRNIVEDIHRQYGVAILNHPYVVPSGDWARYRLINDEEHKVLEELLGMVDEVEVNNGQCINLFYIDPYIWPISRVSMEKANRYAKKLIKGTRFNGTAASDMHNRLEQLRTSGIWIPREHLDTDGIEALKYYILNKDFERQDGLVSNVSFCRGHFKI